MSKKKISLFRYRHALPQILLYQLISKAILGVGLYFFGQLTGLLLWSLDRPAFTSGESPLPLRVKVSMPAMRRISIPFSFRKVMACAVSAISATTPLQGARI